ncbi:MAG: hypothetical protein P1U74_04665 [Legionellaceae bacterium]|nr:hypothetical protein [Legionellaceae bacterium]
MNSYQESPPIQSPLIHVNDIDNREELDGTEPRRKCHFGLVAALSMLGPITFSFCGGIGSEALKSLNVDIGVGMDGFMPALLGGVLLSPVLYCLLLIYQNENCTRIRERTIDEDDFVSNIGNPRDSVPSYFMLLMGFSLLLGHSIAAATIGHTVVENVPYSKYHDDLSQLILTIVLGSAIYTSGLAILLTCIAQFFSLENPEEIESATENRLTMSV